MAMTRSLVDVHILPVLGSRSLSDVGAEDIERFLDVRVDSLSKSTLTKLRGILAQAFDFGIRRRSLTWNPARAAELPPGAAVRRSARDLSSSQVRALMNVASEYRLGVWVQTAAMLGLRPGEVSGLTETAIDWDRETVTISRSLAWNQGKPYLKNTKTGGTRTLRLPPALADALRAHRKRTIEERLLMGEKWPVEWSDLVFVSERGTPVNPANMRRLLDRLTREAGIDGTVAPYDLRHTATTLMAEAGVPADRLADQLGHKDTRMVFHHYRHRASLTVDAAAEYWST
jgi:integrase